MPYRGNAELACPHCEDAVLSPQKVQWIARRACTSCRGVWFDHCDLADLGSDLRVQLCGPFGEVQEQDKAKNCPQCVSPMMLELVSHKKSSVPIDVCHTCGVWFDHEELEPVLEILMAIEDAARSPFSRTNRPWWAATLSFLVASLGGGGNKRVGW